MGGCLTCPSPTMVYYSLNTYGIISGNEIKVFKISRDEHGRLVTKYQRTERFDEPKLNRS